MSTQNLTENNFNTFLHLVLGIKKDLNPVFESFASWLIDRIDISQCHSHKSNLSIFLKVSPPCYTDKQK